MQTLPYPIHSENVVEYTKACVKTNIAITMEIKPGLGNGKI
jgi:hypothetical protein